MCRNQLYKNVATERIGCDMTIRGRLKQWRAYKQLKQSEVGTLLGIHSGNYQKYELDISKPGADAIEAFVKAGINANWLLTGTGPMLVADYPAPAATALEPSEPVLALDYERLTAAILMVEQVLADRGHRMTATAKTKAIGLAYQVLQEEAEERERALFNNVEKIVKKLLNQ